MTQDVQPLTWQKRTNLEEHQQFFSKINEIIDNLAPTVDEAEAAIAQATQAIADANAAIATANAASAAADAAAQQAQTAADTVAGYNSRLTAAEGSITSLGTRMTVAESKNAQQDTAISELQTADANNVKITGTHNIGNYAVLLTGNQAPIAGIKTFTNPIVRRTGIANPTPSFVESTCFTMSKTDDTVVGMVNVAATATTNIFIIRTNSPTDPAKYSKLFLRVSDTGKCDLVMESNTQQGYEQHVIYSFGS